MKCTVCPRECAVNRIDRQGFCQSGQEPRVAAICVHKGEEPPLCGEKGICNVFFVGCNLHCVYCQNDAISGQGTFHSPGGEIVGVDAIVDAIAQVLAETENIVGFVTPTHYAHSLPAIVEGLHDRGLYPTTVYNTGGYERVETLRMIAPYIDIYLPDMKYANGDLALRYSHAADYPGVAEAALREMYNQKGSALPTDDRGMAFRGIIVRHLVLPGQVANSMAVLDRLADISTNLHVALMAQYYPPRTGLPDELNRTLTAEEYDSVTRHLQDLGLDRGWVQELAAEACYRPDFAARNPFVTDDGKGRQTGDNGSATAERRKM